MSFEAAAKWVQDPKNAGDFKPSNSDKLKIYGLFKQANIGDCNTKRPMAIQMTEAAKWDAWNALKGMSSDEAKTKYVALVKELCPGASF